MGSVIPGIWIASFLRRSPCAECDRGKMQANNPLTQKGSDMSEAILKDKGAGTMEGRILEAFRALSRKRQKEVLDFTEFLLKRQDGECMEDEEYDCEDLMDAIVEGLRAVKEGRTFSWKELTNEVRD